MRFLLYICTAFSLVASNNLPSNSFKLEGFVEEVKNPENITLYYFTQKNNELHEVIDSAKIINGKFVFEGNINELTAAELCFENSNVSISVRIYLEPTTMKLRINKAQPYAYELSGTKVEKENVELRKELAPDAKIYYEGLYRMNDLFKEINSNMEGSNNLVLDSLINILQYTKENTSTRRLKMNKIYRDFILKHNTYQIVPDLLYLLTKSEYIPIDTIKNIYNNLSEQSKAGISGKLAFREIKNFENRKDQDPQENTLIGNFASDFIRNDVSGKIIRLSDFKDKNLVLLDFWASWCAPCIKEIPKMKDMYDRYNKKGLTIISVSLDDNKNKWTNAINKYELKGWPQILSTEDNNNSALNIENICLMYNVSAIPHFILIDKQGKIIARWGYLGKEQLNEIDKILQK